MGNNCSATHSKRILKEILTGEFLKIRSILKYEPPTFAKATVGKKKALPIGHRKSFDGINKVE